MTSVGLPTFETWRRFEGQIVNGEFHLHQYLGGSDYAGVFLTQRNSEEKAAIKILAEDPHYGELQLARWRMAEELSHPHLLRIFGFGRCELDGRNYLYVLMEYADENLAHILPHRALTPRETRDMLLPLAQTLGFLHERGIVHGHIKPANIMAVADQLKISTDGISTEPDSGMRPERRTAYEAPESYGAQLTPASDVWSLGMTLVEVLMQRLPTRSGAELIATGLPAPFGEIARNCLRIDPLQRWSISGIMARLEGPPPAPPIHMVSRSAGERAAEPPKVSSFGKRNLLLRYGIAIAVALVVIAIASMTRKHNSSEPTVVVPAQISRPTTPPPGPETAPTSKPAAQPERAAVRTALPPPIGSRTSAGAVLHEVQPNVSPAARQSVTGHLKVAVRVSVNPSGEVVNQRFETIGPSKYFSRVSMEAARGWKFKPPQVAGQNVSSEWMLRFEYTNSGTQVSATQVAPKT